MHFSESSNSKQWRVDVKTENVSNLEELQSTGKAITDDDDCKDNIKPAIVTVNSDMHLKRKHEENDGYVNTYTKEHHSKNISKHDQQEFHLTQEKHEKPNLDEKQTNDSTKTGEKKSQESPPTTNRSMQTQTDDVYHVDYRTKWRRVNTDSDMDLLVTEPHSTTLFTSDDSSSSEENENSPTNASRVNPHDIFSQIRKIKEKIKASMGSKFTDLQTDTEALLNLSGDIVRQIRMTRCHEYLNKTRTNYNNSDHQMTWKNDSGHEKATKIRCTKVWTPPSDCEISNSKEDSDVHRTKKMKQKLDHSPSEYSKTPVYRHSIDMLQKLHSNKSPKYSNDLNGNKTIEKVHRVYNSPHEKSEKSNSMCNNASENNRSKTFPLKQLILANLSADKTSYAHKSTGHPASWNSINSDDDITCDRLKATAPLYSQTQPAGFSPYTATSDNHLSSQNYYPIDDDHCKSGSKMATDTHRLNTPAASSVPSENCDTVKQKEKPNSGVGSSTKSSYDLQNHYTYMNVGGSPWTQSFDTVVYDLSTKPRNKEDTLCGDSQGSPKLNSGISSNSTNDYWSFYSSQFYYQYYSQYYAACYYNSISNTSSNGINNQDALDLSHTGEKSIMDLSTKSQNRKSIGDHIERPSMEHSDASPQNKRLNAVREDKINNEKHVASKFTDARHSKKTDIQLRDKEDKKESQTKPASPQRKCIPCDRITNLTLTNTAQVNATSHHNNKVPTSQNTSAALPSTNFYMTNNNCGTTYDYMFYHTYPYNYPAYVDTSTHNSTKDEPVDLSINNSPQVLNLSQDKNENKNNTSSRPSTGPIKEWYQKPPPEATTRKRQLLDLTRKKSVEEIQCDSHLVKAGKCSSSTEQSSPIQISTSTVQEESINYSDDCSQSPRDHPEINYHDLVNELKEEFRLNQVHQGEFAKRVLQKSQGYMSDLLQQAEKQGYQPKSIAKQNFVVLYRWMRMCSEDRQRQYEMWNTERLCLIKGPCGRKKITKRTFITSEQKKIMDTWYKQYNMYPRREERLAIADSLELPEEVIKNYFKNKRQRKE